VLQIRDYSSLAFVVVVFFQLSITTPHYFRRHPPYLNHSDASAAKRSAKKSPADLVDLLRLLRLCC